MLSIVLPYPTSVNHYKKIGRLVKTKTGKLYQQRVNTNETKTFYYQVYMLTRSIMPVEGSIFPRSAILQLEVDSYPPDKKKRDLDGILKVLLDSLQRAQIYEDDVQIARLIVQRMDIIPYGQVVVRIQEMV